MGSELSVQRQQAQQAGRAEGAGGALRTVSLHRHSVTTLSVPSRAPIGPKAGGVKIQRGITKLYTGKRTCDSPKLRNKQQPEQVKSRPNSAIIMNRTRKQQHHRYQHPQNSQQYDGGRGGTAGGGRARPISAAAVHGIAVVESAVTKDVSIERDDDIIRLQSVPMIPVIRDTPTLLANRAPGRQNRITRVGVDRRVVVMQ
uniref:Uncharacterized protein n=1 Tax=Anopheles atroparvus TaxID=41427 RepID=A0A182IUH1_ANOAO